MKYNTEMSQSEIDDEMYLLRREQREELILDRVFEARAAAGGSSLNSDDKMSIFKYVRNAFSGEWEYILKVPDIDIVFLGDTLVLLLDAANRRYAADPSYFWFYKMSSDASYARDIKVPESATRTYMILLAPLLGDGSAGEASYFKLHMAIEKLGYRLVRDVLLAGMTIESLVLAHDSGIDNELLTALVEGV